MAKKPSKLAPLIKVAGGLRNSSIDENKVYGLPGDRAFLEIEGEMVNSSINKNQFDQVNKTVSSGESGIIHNLFWKILIPLVVAYLIYKFGWS